MEMQFRDAASTAIVEMRSDALGARVWFDPIGLYVERGTTVRWIVRENVHTATAYHPHNDKRSLRIPEGAMPGIRDISCSRESTSTSRSLCRASMTITARRMKGRAWWAGLSQETLAGRAPSRSTTGLTSREPTAIRDSLGDDI